MATVTRFEFTDDLDGKALDVEDLNIVAWSWLGVDHEIETSTTNLDRIENGRVPLSAVLAKWRRVGGRKRAPAHTLTAPKGSATGSEGSEDTKAIRAWAQDNGYKLSSRGRIPADIAAAFAKRR